jgi:hypothetical protein
MHRDLHRDDRSQQDVGHFQDPSLRFRDIAFARWLPLCCGRCTSASRLAAFDFAIGRDDESRPPPNGR